MEPADTLTELRDETDRLVKITSYLQASQDPRKVPVGLAGMEPFLERDLQLL